MGVDWGKVSRLHFRHRRLFMLLLAVLSLILVSRFLQIVRGHKFIFWLSLIEQGVSKAF